MRTMMALALAALPAWAAAQDVDAGTTLYDGNCANCHGPAANGMASFPKLTGHDAAYLTDRLETYRAGGSVGYNSALMIPNAVDLSDDDIADVVAYIGSLG